MLCAHEFYARKVSSVLRHCSSVLLATTALTVGSQTLCAQNAQRNPRGDAGAAAGGGALEIAKAEGKLEAQQGQTVKITSEDKKDYFLVLSQETSLKYSGEADPKWLVPGLMVRFTANFDSGKPVGTVKNLEVFMPVRSNRMTMEQAREQTPGIYQEGKAPPPGAKGLFAEEQKDAKKDGSAPAQTPATSGGAQAYRVVGSLRGVHQNTLLVSAGPQPVQVELDPSATITVTAGDLSFASKGDEVKVSGLRKPSQPDWIQAEKIEIKAAKKLTQAQPAPRGGKMRTGGRGRGANADFGDGQADKAGDDGAPAAGEQPGRGRRPAAGRRTPANGRAPGAN